MLYYVYIYFDVRSGRVGQPIYIGKGSKSRAYWHWLKGTANRRLKHKLQKIRVLGLAPKIVLWRCFRDEASAYTGERYLIAKYGRLDLGTGPLTNADDGGGPGPRRWVCDAATRAKISKGVLRYLSDPQNMTLRVEQLRAMARTAANRERVSRQMKAVWSAPEQRAHRSAVMISVWRDSVKGERMRIGLSKGRSLEKNVKTSATLKKFYADPSNRKALSERASRAYRNPIILRQRQERQQTTEFREQASRKAKQAWDNPTVRAKYLATSKSKSEKLKAAWANPKIRARIVAGQRAAA